MKRIGIIGAPSTGKTTLARNLVTDLNLKIGITEYVPEYAARYIKKFGTPVEVWENIRIFNKQMEWEDRVSDKNLYMVTDSPLILPFLYSMYSFDPNSIKSCMAYTDLFKMTMKIIDSYDLIIYLEPTIKPIDDGIRTQVDDNSQQNVDNKLNILFELFQLDKMCNLMKISETDLTTRLIYCISEIQSI